MTMLSSKDPVETIVLSFALAGLLGTGETLTSVTSVSAWVEAGADPSPAAILSGSSSIVGGTTIVQAVTGGINGTYYAVQVVAATSAGQVLADTVVLPVISQS